MSERSFRPNVRDLAHILSAATILSTTGARPLDLDPFKFALVREILPDDIVVSNGLQVVEIPEVTPEQVSRHLRNSRWITSEREVWEYTNNWYPMSKRTARDQGIPTLYDIGGSLDKYDNISRRLGFASDARRWDEQFSASMIKRQIEDDRKFNRSRDSEEWLGNCQGLANAQALELEPPGMPVNIMGQRVSYDNKVGILVAEHTPDGVGSYTETEEGIKSLLGWFKRTKKPIVIELARPLVSGRLQEGKWFRTVDAVSIDGRFVRATDINEGKVILPASLIRAAYIPVPNASVNSRSFQLMNHWNNPWIKENIVDFIVYGKPLD